MSISRDEARSCVSRFANRPGYPDTKEGRKALIDAFAQCADERHANLAVDDLQIECHFCPTPAEVHRVRLATRPERKSSQCEECDGTGWRPVVKRGVSAVELCRCRKGAA